MTTQEMIEKVTEIAENTELFYVGIRFEDKSRDVGEFIEDCSKANPDREDDRDFPEYGTTEYDELPELNGVCAYSYNSDAWIIRSGFFNEKDVENVEAICLMNHCYVIGTDSGIEYGADDGEIIMPRATVLGAIF